MRIGGTPSGASPVAAAPGQSEAAAGVGISEDMANRAQRAGKAAHARCRFDAGLRALVAAVKQDSKAEQLQAFDSFRRGCLDIGGVVSSIADPNYLEKLLEATDDQMVVCIPFLVSLGKQKMYQRRVAECVEVLARSSAWNSVLRRSPEVHGCKELLDACPMIVETLPSASRRFGAGLRALVMAVKQALGYPNEQQQRALVGRNYE